MRYEAQFIYGWCCIFGCINAFEHGASKGIDEANQHIKSRALLKEKNRKTLEKLYLEMPDDEKADKLLLHYAELTREKKIQKIVVRVPDDKWVYKSVYDGEGNPSNLTMDVYLPEGYYANSESFFPTFVFYHGGAWSRGTPTIGWGHCAHYTSIHDAICVSIDYRLGGGIPGITRCVTDAKAAIRYLRFNSKKLRIDINKIVAIGDSAGGHLAAATATTVDDLTNEDLYYRQGVSAVPDMVIMLNPFFSSFQDSALEDQDKIDIIYPEAIVRAHNAPSPLPPMITFIGEADEARYAAKSFHDSVQADGSHSFFYLTKSHPGVQCEVDNCLTAEHGIYSPGIDDYDNPNTYYMWHITDLFLLLNGFVPFPIKWPPL